MLRRLGLFFDAVIFGSGGEGGIRTLGTDKRTHAFQACSIGHSDTSPHGIYLCRCEKL